MILIAGFPYVRERYFATFRSWPGPVPVRFLLPRRWTAKKGAVVFTPPTDANITRTAALFHHSRLPLLGGLLKGWMPAFPLHLWRMRRDVRLVYACSEPILLSTLWFAVWSRLLGKSFVCFTWENIPYEHKFRGLSRVVHALLLKANLALTHTLICGNTAGEAIHRRYTRMPIAVIPMNGVDPAQFHREAPQPSSLSSHTLYTFVGAIGYRKGIHHIIRALPDVLRSVPTAHVLIAGSGEYEREIDRCIEESGVREHVTRLPWVDQKDLIRLLSASAVFLYPSMPHKGWAEQFGYSMAEASLMGLPVIATRSGSIPEVVLDGTTGILVPPNDTRALADAMIRLGTDEALRRRLGEAGRAYVSERFSHTHVARQWYDALTS